MSGIYISRELKKQLYAGMLRIRIVEEVIAEHYAEQEMRCPTHFSIGQEATPVGVCANLRPEDLIVSNHRCHGHYLARGGDLGEMIAELYGKVTGSTGGKGGSMHLIDKKVNFVGSTSIVAGTIPVGVGLGFANKLKGREGVAVVFLGDGATEEGPFYESINFAALHKLPVFFVCENNLFSIFSPLSVRQPTKRKIFKVAQALGIESRRVDGNDVEMIYKTSYDALQYIRSGEGPFLLEAMTYRYLEHCGPLCDDALGYRSKKELARWKKRDPVLAYERRLLKEKVITQSFVDKKRVNYNDETRKAVADAKSAPWPSVADLKKDVYAK